MANNRLKLTAGLLKMPEAQRQDLARMGENYKRLQEADYLRKMGEQSVGLAKSVARGVPQMATGLVDLAAMPFEYAGVIQPGQAVGSTKWLESKGYLPEQQEGFINQTAELLSGGFDPSDLIAKGLPALGMIGKTVWHGSPHTFDKFDLSKIGTGEGAQAYGHGLYLAEARPVAEEYASNLSKDVFNVGGELFNPADIKHLNVRTLARKGDLDSAINKAAELAASDSPVADLARLDLDLLQQAKAKGGFQEAPGYLYKVELPDEQIAKMLDWDKPLSEQPEIMNQLRQSNVFGPNSPSWAGAPEGAWERNIGARTGSDFYLKNKWADDQAKGSAMLYEAGIPGIQYLDQASRNQAQRFIARSPQGGESVFNTAEEAQQFIQNMAKRGHEFEYVAPNLTRNYVVFSDEIPQILERNGQPVAQALRDYRGAHTAPGPEFGAQLHDLTGGGQMYPDDVYSPNAYRFYGHGGPDVALDKETTKIAQSFRGKPDEMVDIYRAVPNEADITAINAGDWVTINPNYAKQHGESQLGGDYKILQQKVPAKTIWTNADSIHEYGYWPE